MSATGQAAAPAPVPCPNCAQPLLGAFCHACGNERAGHHDHSLKHFLHYAFHEIFHVDGKIVLTLRSLVTRPGFLTQEYFAGRRDRYIRPLRLFLIIFALNFFLFSAFEKVAIYDFKTVMTQDKSGAITQIYAKRAAKTGRTVDQMVETSTRRWQRSMNLVLLLEVLLLAGVLAAFYRGRNRFFVEHLVFSLHYFSVVMLLSTLLFPIYWFTGINPTSRSMSAAAISFALLAFYLFKALKLFYGEATKPTLYKTVVFLAAGQVAMMLVVIFTLTFAIVSTIFG